MLGIEDWARTFQTRTEIPEDCVEKPLRLDAGFGEAEVIEVSLTTYTCTIVAWCKM